MDIRSPLPPDDGADDRSAAARPDGAVPEDDEGWVEEEDLGPVDRVSFRVPTWAIVVKFAVAGGIALLAAFAPQPAQTVVGLIVALGVAAYAARDLLVRERLRADADGLVAARGYAGRSTLRWDDVERLRVDSRTRLGASSSTLEIDAGDHIFFFSRHDLGVEPDDALALLEKVRAA